MRKILFGKEAQEKLLVGFDKVADAVSCTVGPRGLNVFIDEAIEPKIVNDGYTIALNSQLVDKVENMGAHLIRNTSSQTNDDVGDGTTTTAILLQSIVHECLKRPENPMEIRASLQKAVKSVLVKLKKMSRPLKDEDLERVALISAEDKLLAKLISETIKKKGKDVVITVENSKTFETHMEESGGYEAAVGFLSPAFINQKGKALAIYEDVPVFVSQKKISTLQDLKPLLDQFNSRGKRECVIVCEEIENSMLGILAINKQAGNFNFLVIRATGPLLEDIEAVVGAKRVSDITGLSFDQVNFDDHLGKVKRIVCDANKSVFIADEAPARAHATHLESLAKEERNMFSRHKMEERVAKLRGGISILRVFAFSDFDREYLKLKADDAIKAVKAAMSEGIVEGGGMALWGIAQEMRAKTVGERILKKSLEAPFKKIVENCGKDYAQIHSVCFVNRLNGLLDEGGYDAKNNKYVDMMKEGIIDPTKVERCALTNAVSAASTFITTYATICDVEEEPKQ